MVELIEEYVAGPAFLTAVLSALWLTAGTGRAG
ncbi:hypothetical protein BMS3Abin01_00636 [bacterium BMS3Abin01]|nr:hypothetical protein BMS3Abin01_00636 [bacterium BMS3Abin01]